MYEYEEDHCGVMANGNKGLHNRLVSSIFMTENINIARKF